METAAQLRRMRIRVILVCGMAVAAIVAVLLSGWNDEASSFGGINSSTFILQANSGQGWGDYGSLNSSTTLSFGDSDSIQGTLAPGQTMFAPIALRASPETNTNGQPIRVYLKGAIYNSGPLVDYLRYTVKVGIPAENCTASDFAGVGQIPLGFPALALLHEGSGSDYLTIENHGDILEFCFAVSLPSDPHTRSIGLTGNATWEFVGELGW